MNETLMEGMNGSRKATVPSSTDTKRRTEKHLRVMGTVRAANGSSSYSVYSNIDHRLRVNLIN